MSSYSQSIAPEDESWATGQLSAAAATVMQLRTVRWADERLTELVGRPVPKGAPVLELRGRFLIPAEEVYSQLSERFASLGYVLMLREDKGDQVILAIPGALPRESGRPWVAVALFAATLLSVLWVGAEYEGSASLLGGWPFAASLLGILLAHEMGHYLVARWLGVPASLPYFIPMPVSLLGTMGAVIQTRAPTRNRRELLLLGASGPLAGMVVAIPVLFLGLSTSHLGFIPQGLATFQEGNSLLYAAAKLLVFGRFLPSGNLDVFINSVAMAGWAGLLVTGLNLIPAGQLDGGHVAYALLGRRAKWLTWVVVVVMLGLSPLWQGWLLWAALVLLLGRVHAVPLDDVTPLRTKDKMLAFLAIAVFVLVFIPVPMSF